MSAFDAIAGRIREHGPITAAECMAIALYDPACGYYARAAQRSGRRGDFFTSVDVGPLFGELLAVQFEEIWRVHLGSPARFDLVEAGAGNGRLSRDVLDAAAREWPAFYQAIRLSMSERSLPARREALRVALAPHADRIAGCSADLPDRVTGVIFANELLDAMPAHTVVMTPAGLREIYVDARDGGLAEIEGPPSDPDIARHIAAGGGSLPIGCRADVSLAATRWVAHAARALSAGVLMIIDYGRPARELYSASHAAGTRMAYRAHASANWLESPGETDLTTHVDLTAVQNAAEAAGLRTLNVLDQTYFLGSLGLADRLPAGDGPAEVARRLAAKTLMLPGGLGSTMKVLAFARHGAAAPLTGLAAGRLT